jgi:methionyl aminopeptidase
MLSLQKTHKIVHDLAKGLQPVIKNADGTFNPWQTFDFKGPLRPQYPLSPKREVPAHITRPEYADDPEGGHFLLRALRDAWRMRPVG